MPVPTISRRCTALRIIRICFTAHARKYHERPAENNAKDATEVTTFGPREIGAGFRRVTGVPSAEGGGR